MMRIFSLTSVALLLALTSSMPSQGSEPRYDLLIQGASDHSVIRYHGITGESLEAFVQPRAGGLDSPHNPTFGPDGNLYVISNGTSSIKRYDGMTGEYIDDFVPFGTGGFDGSSKIAFGPDGNLYAANFNLRQVLRFSGDDGSFLGVAAQGQGMSGTCGIAFGGDGMLYVLDNPSFAKVLRFNGATGEFVDEFVPTGHLFNSCDLTFGPDDDLYITDVDARNVQRWDGATGEYLGVFATLPASQVNGPSGLVFNPDGDLFVNNGNTLKFDGATGEFIEVFVSGNGGFANFMPYTTTDEPLPTGTFAVTNTNDTGPGSLRQAISNANLNFQGSSRIIFNIPGDGVRTIIISASNPIYVTRPTEIDGFTQPGASPNTLANGIDARLLIQIRGGLTVSGDDSTIRGLIFNTSRDNGLSITGGGNVVEGCFIGTDPTGTVGLGHENSGIAIGLSASAKANRIGGPAPAQRNLISGNQGAGIFVAQVTTPTLIQNNYIGTDVTGRRRLGNRIGVQGGHAIIGGAGEGEGNRIAFNETGVWAESDPGLSVLGNSIFGNFNLGIDLGTDTESFLQFPNGPTPNDDGDADTGANGFQNAPDISSLTTAGGSTTVEGSLNSMPNATYRVEFFANSTPDILCFGEGETYLGFREITTDADGKASFSADFPGEWQFVSATATDAAGNTSEFSMAYIPFAGPFAPGDIFVSGTSGIVQRFGADGRFKGCLDTGMIEYDTYGMTFGPDGSLFVTGLLDNGVTQFDTNGARLGIFASGYEGYSWFIRFDGAGNAYVSNGNLLTASGEGELRKFDPQGGLLQEYSAITPPTVSLTSFAILPDDRTLLYATEGINVLAFLEAVYEKRIGRYDLVADEPLPDFASDLPGFVRGIELLPDGRVLAAIESEVILLSASGEIVASYDVPGENSWNSVALGEDGQTFWAGSDGGGYIYRFNLAGGGAVQRIFIGEVFEVSLLVKPGASAAPIVGQGVASQEFFVTNANDAGPGSLRAAIEAANATFALDTISFSIPGAGPHTIPLESGLPEITAPVSIDGYTQSGSQLNTVEGAALQTISIIIDGSQTDPLTDGLVVSAGGSTVSGLSIVRFPGSGLVVTDSGSVQVFGNYLGVTPDWTAAGNGHHGILLNNAFEANLGHNGAESANLISGNFGAGIAIQGDGALDNAIAWNLIGTDPLGTTAMGNGGAGVLVTSSSQYIGGNLEGSGGNVIAFNHGAGVEVFGSLDWNRFRQSLFQETIGVRITGNSIFSNGGLGIDLIPPGVTVNDPGFYPDEDDGPNNRQDFPVLKPVVPGATSIGGEFGSTTDYGFRIEVFACPECDPSGFGEGREFLGSTTLTTDEFGLAEFLVPLSRPLAEGEFVTAVAIADDDDTSEFSECVRVSPPIDLSLEIAASPDPVAARAELTYSITIRNDGPGAASGIVLNTTIPKRTDFVSSSAACDLGFNRDITCSWETLGAGESIEAMIVVRPQFIGTVKFAASVGGTEFESDLADNSQTTETQVAGEERVLVVTNTDSSGPGSLQAAILDVNANGVGADTITFDIPGAGAHRIKPDSDLPLIRVPVVIDGYSQPGSSPNTLTEGSNAVILIEIEGAPPEQTPGGGVIIGTGVATGLQLRAPGSVVRGLAIFNCGINGISISDNDYSEGDPMTIIEGCFLGTDATGLNPLGNLQAGANVSSGLVRIGGPAPAARNLISANGNPDNSNTGYGIYADFNAEVIIQNNLIGTDATGVNPLGNLNHGIQVRSPLDGSAIIGGRGDGEGNVIAFNGGSGVYSLTSEALATIVGNSIFMNGQLGIGGSQPTPNLPGDPLDVEDGQVVQNFPTIASAVFDGASTRVTGALDSRPNEDFTLDFYANTEPDPSFFGEGRFFLGSVEVTSDGSGAADFDAAFEGEWNLLTATATDARGRTSEFSLVALPDPGVFARGDLFIYLRSGFVQWLRNDGALAKLLDTEFHPDSSLSAPSDAALDPAGNLYVLGQTDSVSDEFESLAFKFDSAGNLVGTAGGDFEGSINGITTDAAGNVYIATLNTSADVRKYDANGQFVEAYDVENISGMLGGQSYDASVRYLQIGPDQRTLYYSTEQFVILFVGAIDAKSIKRFDLVTRTQLPDFATDLPSGDTGKFQLLPDGGALVADFETILRLNASGQIVQTYDLEDQDRWELLAIDPDAQTFWASYPAAGFGGVHNFAHRFDLATGDLLDTLDLGSNAIVRALVMAPSDGVPPAPGLTITAEPDGRVKVSWPDSAADFSFQTTASLAAPIKWSPVTAGVNLENGEYVFRIDPMESARFYRLERP